MSYALTNFGRTRKSVDGRDVLKDLNSLDYEEGSSTGSKNKKQGSNSSYSRKSNKDSKTRKRVKSIDVIRGLAIGLMIVGNNQAIWQRVYPPLRHAVWNGVTLADFAFPFFVISLGVTIPISIDSRLKRNDSTLTISLSIIRRSVMLILFGIFLNYLKNQDLNTIRILGVLQRMGLVYFVTSFVYLFMRKAKKERFVYNHFYDCYICFYCSWLLFYSKTLWFPNGRISSSKSGHVLF
jgi:predicted acyltransferase